MLADDVGGPHRLQELLGPLEVLEADHHAAETLCDVAVGPGAGDDVVLAGEPDRLLVERVDRDPRVEHLEDVDLLDDVEEVLVVRHRVHAVERVRDVDEPALPPDLGDRLRERHPALDLLLEEEADHLALVRGLHLLGDDDLDPDLVGDLAGLESPRDLVVVRDRDRPEARARRPSRAACGRGWRNPASGPCACGGRSGSARAPSAACAPRGPRQGRGGARPAVRTRPRRRRSPRPSRAPRRTPCPAPREPIAQCRSRVQAVRSGPPGSASRRRGRSGPRSPSPTISS